MNCPGGRRVCWSVDDVARNAAQDIPDGSVVNLGIGIPELVTRYIPAGREVMFQTENGLLGMGASPAPGLDDPDLINAGKRCVTAIAGAAYFDHATSFAMIRGGHIDLCILGALQVSQSGDLANWSTGDDDMAPAVGGAMDLVAGARTTVVAMRHCTRDGKPKIVKSCTYPLTGAGVVRRIYTDMAILEVRDAGLEVLQLAPGVDFDMLQEHTEATLVTTDVLQSAMRF